MNEFPIEDRAGFMGAWYLDDATICDELIDYFQASPRKVESKSYPLHGQAALDKSNKDSIDCPIDADCYQDPVVRKYFEQLKNVVDHYTQKYPYSRAYGAWGLIDTVNIQYYPSGGGFKKYYTQRLNASHPATTRHLLFMTYLNDVNDNGGTEFFHQKLVTPAQKGLTLIWPADWTYTHLGVVSATEKKYIITEWFNCLERKLG